MERKKKKKSTQTSSFGSSGRESHDATPFYTSRLYNGLPQEKKVKYRENSIPAKYLDKNFCKSAENMEELPNESVHLMVTSPPYGVGKEYDKDFTLQEYLEFLKRVWTEVRRVLVPGGRICINIANLGRKPYIPIHSFIINDLHDLGFLMRGEIIWDKSASAGTSTAWGCYDENTRILTTNGLKFFRDIDINNDRFATLNLKKMKLEYQRAFDFVEKDYSGDVYSIYSKNFDLVVTPEHNFVYIPRKYITRNDNFVPSISPLYELINKSQFYIPKTINTYDEGTFVESFNLPPCSYEKRTKKNYIDKEEISINMMTWLKFLGIFLTDGNVYYSSKKGQYVVSIYQQKSQFIQDIQDLLDNLPFDFKFKESKSQFYVCNKRLAEYLSQFMFKNEKLFPRFIHDLSLDQKRIFVEWMFKGDGCLHKDGNWRYFATTSRDIRDNMFHLLLQLGYNFSFYAQKEKSGLINSKKINRTKPTYRINLKRSKFFFIRNKNTKKIPYNGKIYCVSVPNKTLFVERNGKFTWCGNSWKSASNPVLRDVHEYILIFSKDNFKRVKITGREDTISKEEFLEFTKSVWTFPTESAQRIGHPAPFPIELPYRIIQLFSYQNDVVLDPFMGSGQTAIAAIKTQRHFIGYDIDPEYIELARKRIQDFTRQSSLDKFL